MACKYLFTISDMGYLKMNWNDDTRSAEVDAKHGYGPSTVPPAKPMDKNEKIWLWVEKLALLVFAIAVLFLSWRK